MRLLEALSLQLGRGWEEHHLRLLCWGGEGYSDMPGQLGVVAFAWNTL